MVVSSIFARVRVCTAMNAINVCIYIYVMLLWIPSLHEIACRISFRRSSKDNATTTLHCCFDCWVYSNIANGDLGKFTAVSDFGGKQNDGC